MSSVGTAAMTTAVTIVCGV
ncbi:hypothetical protein FYK55_09870 [Roseiconus nitratireducens]|uniref:Uncharacterized protein n=1 Tax=Roseiconus nitratireducens TaxID=2605748 RepID=A0A5M6DHG2_9BACT|nr:hypothetical protein FYK55_09870 [Roseiconus nitratireducens]